MLAIAVVLINPTLQMPAVTKFIDGSGLVFAGPVFPFVCITIACGAVSGFHSLIASGTTPKMIRRESRIRSIGYGANGDGNDGGLMAMIAACVFATRRIFRDNTKGRPPKSWRKLLQPGFPVTEQQMQTLATESWRVHNVQSRPVARRRLLSAWHTCSRAFLPSRPALRSWYHFAIMFEGAFYPNNR
jgi:carbon starvation protein